jgi:hypothetical protein
LRGENQLSGYFWWSIGECQVMRIFWGNGFS